MSKKLTAFFLALTCGVIATSNCHAETLTQAEMDQIVAETKNAMAAVPVFETETVCVVSDSNSNLADYVNSWPKSALTEKLKASAYNSSNVASANNCPPGTVPIVVPKMRFTYTYLMTGVYGFFDENGVCVIKGPVLFPAPISQEITQVGEACSNYSTAFEFCEFMRRRLPPVFNIVPKEGKQGQLCQGTRVTCMKQPEDKAEKIGECPYCIKMCPFQPPVVFPEPAKKPATNNSTTNN